VTGRSQLRVSGVDGKILLDVEIDDLRRAHAGSFQG
jgi:hypothetical protein